MAPTILVPEKKIEVPADKESYFFGAAIDDWFLFMRDTCSTGPVPKLMEAAAPDGETSYRKLLLNEEATEDAIFHNVEAVMEAAPEESLVTVYLNGHGDHGYFCASAGKGNDRRRLFKNYENSPLTYFFELRPLLNNGSSKKALILDACNAGSFPWEGYQGMFLGACEDGQTTCAQYDIASELVLRFEKARKRNGPGYGWREFLANDAAALDGFSPGRMSSKGNKRGEPINYVVKGAEYLR